ncbi:MAG: hypothetical protein FI698_00655 [SAR202 cluster bacterium]|nr:hypothetical protein [SAR202 cluster bacterium]|tara:strand:+ start:35168 stop:36121 length:954 start_codon:yes stop_codon:yes gene_type:complete
MSDEIKLGQNQYTYLNLINWPKLPEGIGWHEVAGVAVGSDELIYIFSRGDYPILVLDKDGNYVKTWGQGIFTSAHAITPGPENTFYCTDHFDHTIRWMTSDGEIKLTLGTQDKPSAIHGGKPFNKPTDVAVDKNTGDIFVSDGYMNSAIHRFSHEGDHILSWGSPGVDPGEFSLPHNIAIDDGGYIYVADRENHRIQVFSQDGVFQHEYTNVHRPCALRIGPDGLMYVGELGFQGTVSQLVPNIGPRVSIIDRSGKRLSKVGEHGFGKQPGQMIAPHGIAIDNDGSIYLGEVSKTAGKSWLDSMENVVSFRKLQPIG